MLYNIVLVFVVQQSESVLSTYTPSLLSLHPPHPTPLGHHRALSRASHELSISHMVVYMCPLLLSQFIPPLSSPGGFPGGSDGKEFACNTGDSGLIPGLGRSPGEGNSYPLQYSCLENSMAEEPGRLWSMGL